MSEAPSEAPMAEAEVSKSKGPGGFIKLNADKLQERIRVRKVVTLNKHVGVAAGFDLKLRGDNKITPCGQVIIKVPVVRTREIQAFNVNISDKRVSLTSRFDLPLGALSVKGHARVGVAYETRKPYVGLDVVPTKLPVLAIGATTALFAGKKLGSSPSFNIANNVGLDMGFEAYKDKGGPVTVSMEDASLTIKI